MSRRPLLRPRHDGGSFVFSALAPARICDRKDIEDQWNKRDPEWYRACRFCGWSRTAPR